MEKVLQTECYINNSYCIENIQIYVHLDVLFFAFSGFGPSYIKLYFI